MAEAVLGIHTPPLQLTNIDQGMYVTKTHFTLQCIILHDSLLPTAIIFGDFFMIAICNYIDQLTNMQLYLETSS